VEGIDILELAIGPEEAFVLSRVDGRSNQQDIVFATGLPDQRVARALARLAELGAITWSESTPSNSATAMGSTKASNEYPQSQQVEPVDVSGIRTMGGSGAPPYDPRELEGEYDLDIDKRRLVLDRFYRNDSLSHYDTLGVSSGADRKAIKTAYYDLVAVIHPDKYFGRNIGHFRKKMEQCFARITEAYDVLSRETTRQEYDAYLISQQQVADLQRALDMHVTADELDRLEADLMRLADNATSSSPPAEVGAQVPASNAVSVIPQTGRVLTEQERRQALANAFRRTAPGVRVTSSARASSPDLSSAADGLRRHYESRLQHARQSKLKSHLQAAKDALSRNDPVTACNELRIAQRLAPDDNSIALHLSEVQVQANSVLVDRYLEQARYEERHGRLETASRNYSLAAQARPNADLWERAARCALGAKTDLRSAAEMAKKALEFDPERVSLHALLAEVYIEAQLNASAAVELERAARLAPNDDSIRELRRRLERSGT
jgi:curved DNA-binding protein CbpA